MQTQELEQNLRQAFSIVNSEEHITAPTLLQSYMDELFSKVSPEWLLETGDQLGFCDGAKMGKDAKAVVELQKSDEGRAELRHRLAEKQPHMAQCRARIGQLMQLWGIDEESGEPSAGQPLRAIPATPSEPPMDEVRKLVESLAHQPRQSSSLATTDVVAAFLKSKRGMVAGKSLESYRHTLNPFAKEYPVLPTAPEEIEAYLARTQFRKRKSAAGAHTVLRMLYKFAEQRYGVPNVLRLVQKPSVKQSEPHAFSLDEFRLIVGACNDDRDLGLVHLSGGHGLRNDEMCRLLVGDIADDRIFIGGKERDEALPLLPETLSVLRRLAANRNAQAPLFESQMKRQLSDRMAYNVVKAVLTRAGVLNDKPADWHMATHALRKTFASLALAAGCDSRIVQRLLRHKRRDTTDLYLSIPFEMMRQNLERYSPLRLLNQNQQRQEFPKILSCSTKPPFGYPIVGKAIGFA